MRFPASLEVSEYLVVFSSPYSNVFWDRYHPSIACCCFKAAVSVHDISPFSRKQ